MRNSKSSRALPAVLLSCCLLAGLAYGDTTNSLTVLENGNVGIGTTTPGQALTIIRSGGTIPEALCITNYGNSDNRANIGLGRARGTFASPLGLLAGDDISDIIFSGYDGSAWANTGSIKAGVSANWSSTSRPTYLSFNTTNVNETWRSERVRINANGNVGIGTTNPAAKLDVNVSNSWNGIRLSQDNNTNGDGGKIYFVRTRNGGSASTGDFIGVYGFMFKDSGGNTVNGAEINSVITDNSNGSVDANMNFLTAYNGSWGNRMTLISNGYFGIGTTNPQYRLDVNGYVRATNVSVSSDIRLKENVKPIPDALDRMAHLQGVGFNWKDKARGEGAQMGVIAQDVEKIFPEAVLTDSEGYKSVSYTSLVAPLVEAVKQLKAESDNLRSENDHLRARLEALEKKIKN